MTSARVFRAAAWLVMTAGVVDLVARQIARTSLIELAGGSWWGPYRTVALVGISAIVAAARVRGSWAPWARRGALFVALFAAGVAAQGQLGARLQSDGFYYYAYARSIWFDRDVDLTNDYRMLGLDDAAHRHLFQPTVTGHAQTTWAIGPALAWSPFIALGHVTAITLQRTRPEIATDGTSFPYRQAVCLAGLFYGLLGLFACYGVTRERFPSRVSTAAVVTAGAGSFVLWYLVREPTMSHAVSMAAVAAVVWAWMRLAAAPIRPIVWTGFGLAAGFMVAVRWQNVLVLLLPAATLAARFLRAHDRPARLRVIQAMAGAGVGLIVGFLPQMLAWRAIYGEWLARAPIAPVMRWTAPELVDTLWSSRNGLFATSPALYAGALGLLLLWRRDWRLSLGGLTVFGLMTWTNAAVEDWYGGAGFGGRRFDSLVPFFALGLAAFAAWLSDAVRRRPFAATATLAGVLVLWNAALMGVARSGRYRIGQPVSFGDVGAWQADEIHGAIGHPPSYPANLLYAARHRVAPGRYDLLRTSRFLGDPSRPYGRVDFGLNDDVFLEGGWHSPERDGDTTFRWGRAIGGLIIPLDRPADLLIQVRLRPFEWPDAPPQALVVEVNGSPFDAVPVAAGWTVVERATPRDVWRAGPNRVTLRFARETRPADVGPGGDTRPLAVAVDYVRVVVPTGR